MVSILTAMSTLSTATSKLRRLEQITNELRIAAEMMLQTKKRRARGIISTQEKCNSVCQIGKTNCHKWFIAPIEAH